MYTNITTVVSYSVVEKIIHTDGSENVRKEFDNAFTEIVRAFGNTYDQIDITETVRMHIYANPLLEMQSTGNIYVVKQEIAHHQSFAPDTNGTLAEQNSQYEKHKAYIISPENKDMPKEINYYIAIPFLSTDKNNFNCYTMPLHPAVLKHVIGFNNYNISKCTETYNKLRNWEIRCSLNKPDHKFKIGLEELDLRAAIGDNFRQWLSHTNQNPMPDTSIAIKKIPEFLRFSINRYIERIKHGQSLRLCTAAKNHVAKKIPFVPGNGMVLEKSIVPKFQMSSDNIEIGFCTSIIKQINMYTHGDKELSDWKWDTTTELLHFGNVMPTSDNYIYNEYYSIEIINPKEKTYMMKAINPTVKTTWDCGKENNGVSIGKYSSGIYYKTTRDGYTKTTLNNGIHEQVGVYIRFMDKVFQVYTLSATGEILLYSVKENNYTPASFVFTSMLCSSPELVEFIKQMNNPQEKLMTSTSPYSDIKWNDIVPWVRDNIFKEIAVPDFMDIDIKGVHMNPLIIDETATKQIANKVLEDKLTLGNKMYSAPIVEDRNLLQEYDEESGEIWTEDTTSICRPMDLLKTHVGDSIGCLFLFRIDNHNNKTYLCRPTYPLPVKYSDFDGTQRTRTITAFSCGIYYKPNYDYMKNAINVATFQGDKYYLIPGTVISYLGKEIAMCINGRTNEVVKMSEAYNSYIPMGAYFEMLHNQVNSKEK